MGSAMCPTDVSVQSLEQGEKIRRTGVFDLHCDISVVEHSQLREMKATRACPLVSDRGRGGGEGRETTCPCSGTTTDDGSWTKGGEEHELAGGRILIGFERRLAGH